MKPPIINLKIKNVTFEENKDLMDNTSNYSEAEEDAGKKTPGEIEPFVSNS